MTIKKLISIADIEKLSAEKKNECPVTPDTIITPAAVDLAEERGIQFVKHDFSANESNAHTASDKIVSDIFQLLKNKDVLQALITSLKDEPYTSERDGSGVEIISGKSVRMDSFVEGNKRICGQILFKNEIKNTEAGLLMLEETDFSIRTKSQELNLILEGDLSVKINGKSYKAQAGDLVSIPAGIQLERSTPRKVKIFYVRS